uniref:Uncharacterized protein n=1 Tax=Rhizophora mucronata TaxID=61149 RepID=A0A2P2PJ50_RHIMU
MIYLSSLEELNLSCTLVLMIDPTGKILYMVPAT